MPTRSAIRLMTEARLCAQRCAAGRRGAPGHRGQRLEHVRKEHVVCGRSAPMSSSRWPARPSRARAVRLSPLVIGATLRIEDSLQAGHSRFYAEILRIRGHRRPRAPADPVAVPARRNPPRHEFLRPPDRRRGHRSRAGRVRRHRPHHDARPRADGAAFAARVPSLNMHFEDRLENGRMVFDYRMRPGVVEHSNALALMRAIGLEV